MTLNYWMMVERYPNLKDEVGGSIPGCEISSLLDKKTCQVVNCLLCFGVGMSTIYLTNKIKHTHTQKKMTLSRWTRGSLKLLLVSTKLKNSNIHATYYQKKSFYARRMRTRYACIQYNSLVSKHPMGSNSHRSYNPKLVVVFLPFRPGSRIKKIEGNMGRLLIIPTCSLWLLECQGSLFSTFIEWSPLVPPLLEGIVV